MASVMESWPWRPARSASPWLVASPLASRLVQRLGGRVAQDVGALRVVEAAPAVRVAAPPPPVFEEAEVNRVTGVAPPSTFAEQRRWLEGTTGYGASHAYQLPPMWLVDGNAARGRFRWEFSEQRERLVSRSTDVPTLRDVALVSTVYGTTYFGHNVTDDLPLTLLGSAYGEPCFVDPPGGGHGQIAGYRRSLGMEHPSHWNARLEGCWAFHDPYLNDSKVERLEALRARLADEVGKPPAPGRRVYLTRGTAGSARAPHNEAQLEVTLRDDGWDVVDPRTAPLHELHRLLAGADVVAGVEGSQLAHAVLASPRGTAMVLLMPPDRFNLLLKDFCDRLGIRLGFHVGVPGAGGWRVDVDGMRRVIERLDRTPVD